MEQKHKINLTDRYVTRDGRPARVICVDRKQDPIFEPRPVVALVEDMCSEMTERAYFYDEFGRSNSGLGSKKDLVRVEPETVTYRGIYRDLSIGAAFYSAPQLYDNFRHAREKPSFVLRLRVMGDRLPIASIYPYDDRNVESTDSANQEH